jgi:hypothetical protein
MTDTCARSPLPLLCSADEIKKVKGLEVTLISGEHLPKMDTFGTCDAFCTIRFGNKVCNAISCSCMCSYVSVQTCLGASVYAHIGAQIYAQMCHSCVCKFVCVCVYVCMRISVYMPPALCYDSPCTYFYGHVLKSVCNVHLEHDAVVCGACSMS